VRRFTLIVLIVLFLLLVGATVFSFVEYNRNKGRQFPGPVPGTPLPVITGGP